MAARVFPSVGNIPLWIMNNQASDTRRGTGIVMTNVVGQCGPMQGTSMYTTSEQLYYRRGMRVSAAFVISNGSLALCLRFLPVWENKKLDEKFGSLETQKAERYCQWARRIPGRGFDTFYNIYISLYSAHVYRFPDKTPWQFPDQI
jgi:hypothetical protein